MRKRGRKKDTPALSDQIVGDTVDGVNVLAWG